jgi:hypothetical protein
MSSLDAPLVEDYGDVEEAILPAGYIRKRTILGFACSSGLFLSFLFRVCMSSAAQEPAEGSGDVTMYSDLKWSNLQQVSNFTLHFSSIGACSFILHFSSVLL